MVKKIIIALLAMLCLSVSASAESVPIEFHKHGGGQYIYCNNPEFLTESDLSTDENPNPVYMMKNEELGPDNYSVFFCFYNWTDFDVEPDIEFKSDNGAVITVNSVGYYLPQDYDNWDCIGVWSDLMGINIRTLNNYQQYVPYSAIDLPQTITLDGDSRWINEFIYNYEPVAPKLTFNMLVNFTIESGTAEVNFAALKNYGKPGDRTHHSPDAKNGAYKNDTSIKGIETESAPIVEADLDIEITEETENGERIPVEIFNQYFPDGNESDFWMTNINPSRDEYYYSKTVAASSDMLSFKFEDESKEQYYGKNVTERSSEWIFDIYHYNTLAYESGMPWNEDDHVPNDYMGDTLDINNLPNINWQFNLGNFGVANRYNLRITNSDSVPRTLNYMLETSLSSNIVIIYDKHGNMLNPYTLESENPFALCKGVHSEKTEDCMFSVEIPAGKTAEYTVDVILPTNCYGGIINYLIADDYKYMEEKELTEFPEYDEYYNYKTTFFNGEQQMKWVDGNLYALSGTVWNQVKLPESALEVFASRSKDMEITKTPAGYAARFSVWDEYGNNIEDTSPEKTVYMFDENFELINTIEFDYYISEMTYADNAVYLKSDGKYISTDGINFKKLTDSFDIPIANGEYSIFKNEDGFYLSGLLDKSKICFESREPDEIYSAGGVFYRRLSWKNYDDDLETGNVLAVSKDGVNWIELYLPNRVLNLKTMEYINNALYIYCKYETFVFRDIFPEDSIKVNLNNEYLSFDVSPRVINDRTLVPLRFIFEKLGADVLWSDEERKITVRDNGTEIILQIDNNTATVNGEESEIDVPPMIIDDKTLIPVRFLAENLGYNVEWNQAHQTAIITAASPSPKPVPSPSPAASSPAPSLAPTSAPQ
ncbi:MAG: copper amine oxidase N-terminal domain-containing protein [Oscillospiraceae bacterium]|nr:copper amine oxidase N-terminal domain-containing protein [Oscillospiraceae bacterium]